MSSALAVKEYGDTTMTGLCLRIGCALLLAVTLVPGCGHLEHRSDEPARRPAEESSRSPTRQDNAIDLHSILIPSSTAQPVRIHLVEHRVTESAETGSTTHDLDLDLRASLKAAKTRDDGTVEATLQFKRIRLTIGMPESTLTYDSRSDKGNTENALADLMGVMAGAELTLLVGPEGRLLKLDGLNHKWRTAGIVLPPPHLLAAHWLFRDNTMFELVSEALFPTMPPGTVQVGDAWGTEVPADIPLAARLESCVRWRVSSISHDNPGSVKVQIDGTGQIRTAELPLKDAPPALRPKIKTGTCTIRATTCPDKGFFQQESNRAIEVELALTPPAGQERLQTTIHQQRRLAAQRGKEPDRP